MLALARFLVLGFVVLTVVYGSLWFYLRANRREQLERMWETDPQGLPQKDFIQLGLAYHDRLRHRFLIITVYVIPLSLVTLIVYLTNFH
ncbi:hypothetical protein [Pseudoponticoccus marisrubri]|uniref:Cation/multidrug efflux pump n=1 Tax=Pseudoponticoccus marisrubri TaxID=1685382 RepID=A0A0W7WIZ8_9RHOB|nr:hypothetical protein [Pseudoponticoccus marisrubri]KUF10611.1 hypothetical protein AVJ23_12095 [Pseudoponticoccus marisrubri]